jgi:hypothetical protein
MIWATRARRFRGARRESFEYGVWRGDAEVASAGEVPTFGKVVVADPEFARSGFKHKRVRRTTGGALGHSQGNG